MQIISSAPHIPYFTTSRYRVSAMVELIKPIKGEIGADLGAGDGRISIAFAKEGVIMDAFEIDEKLRSLAKENIEKENLENINLLNEDFWLQDLSKYDFLCCYPMPDIMGRLEEKLKKELKPGARVVLNYFPFLHWKEKKIKDNIYLYIK